jgi:hypothetical protein
VGNSLPAGATLVSGSLPPSLPPGARLVSGNAPTRRAIEDTATISAAPKPDAQDAATHVLNAVTDPMGEFSQDLNDLTDRLSNYTQQGKIDHPVLSRVGELLNTAREELTGGQSAGKALGTSSGVLNNPVTASMAIAPDAAAVGAAVEGGITRAVSSPGGRAAAKTAADLVLDEVPGLKTVRKIAKIPNATGPITLPSDAFDTSEAEKAVTPFEGVGKKPVVEPPTVRRTPGQIAPEAVGAPKAAATAVAPPASGPIALPEGAVLVRPAKALPAAPEEAQYAYRVRDVGESGIPANQNSPAHATTTLADAQRLAETRGMTTDKLQEIVRTKIDPDNVAVRKPGPNGADWIKFKKPILEPNVEVVQSPKAPKIEDVVKQAAGTPSLEPNVPLRAQPAVVSRSTPTLPAKAFGSTVAPEVSEVTGARTVKPGELPEAFKTEVAKTTGAGGPKPGQTLRQSIENPNLPAAETPKERLQRIYPDKGVRQQVHIVGEDFYEAAKNKPEVLKAATKLSGPDIANAAVNLGEDLGQMRVGSQKAAYVGSSQIKPQELLSRLLTKGYTPEEIVAAAAKKGSLAEMSGRP